MVATQATQGDALLRRGADGGERERQAAVPERKGQPWRRGACRGPGYGYGYDAGYYCTLFFGGGLGSCVGTKYGGWG